MRSFDRTRNATAPVEPVDKDVIGCPVEWSHILRMLVLLGSLEHVIKWPFERTPSCIASSRIPCPSMVISKLDCTVVVFSEENTLLSQILTVPSQEALAIFPFGKALIENTLLVCASIFLICIQSNTFLRKTWSTFSRISQRWIDPSVVPKAIQLFVNWVAHVAVGPISWRWFPFVEFQKTACPDSGIVTRLPSLRNTASWRFWVVANLHRTLAI